MKKIIILALLLAVCLSCDRDENCLSCNDAANMHVKDILMSRPWSADEIEHLFALPSIEFHIKTHRLNFFSNDSFSWTIETSRVRGEEYIGSEVITYESVTYTGTYSFSKSEGKALIELSGEDLHYDATLETKELLSIRGYNKDGYHDLILR